MVELALASVGMAMFLELLQNLLDVGLVLFQSVGVDQNVIEID
jgi:hypothetical protein